MSLRWWSVVALSSALFVGGCAVDGGPPPGTRTDEDPITSEDAGRDAGASQPDANVDAGGGARDASEPECITACETDDCGEIPDGCGGFLSCNVCADGMICGVLRPNKCDFPLPEECTPMEARDACAGKCGTVPDGCSGVISCTAMNGGVDCDANAICGGYEGSLEPNVCVPRPTCTPSSCMDLGVECGPTGDGCGGTLDCTAVTGGCGAGEICGSGAQSGQCVDETSICTPKTLMQACAGTCGVVDDGCGHALDCSSSPSTRCPSGQTCGGGGVPGQCGADMGCVPVHVMDACAGKCGFVSDGCEGGYQCGAGNGGVVCDGSAGDSCGGGGVPNQCGRPACTPLSEAEACPVVGGFESCGQQPDGCGGLVDCGGCPGAQQCGLSTANVCGEVSCTPTPVRMACGGRCGTVPDGCGGQYNCNAGNGGVTCSGDAFCGALEPNSCGVPPQSCTPLTCQELGHSCGLASDGCGNVINCWPGCDPSDRDCEGSCQQFAACLADPNDGTQACVQGGPDCTGELCDDLPSCNGAATTRLTGTVRTPGRWESGWVNRIPVPNAIVYIPADIDSPLPAFMEGVEPGNAASCGRCEDEALVADGESVLAAAVTDYRGQFTLEGRIPVGVPYRLVVKVGKWRRVVEVPASTTTACATTTLGHDLTRLPRNRNDGLSGTHLPKVAISTGRVDEMECVFYNFGVDQTEFTPPTGTGRFHLYRSNGTRTGSMTNDTSVADRVLYSDQDALNSYDLIVWDCEGQEQQHDAHDPKIESYVNAGGRMFASHFSYTWIEGNGSLDQSASWNADGSGLFATGFVSLPSGPTRRAGANPVKSVLFRDWLDWQGALTGTTAGVLDSPSEPQFEIEDPRDRAGASVGPHTDEWVYRNNSGAKVQQLSFNTPYGADSDNICGRVAYSGFHVASADNNDDDDYFPGVCNPGEMTAQEKVLVYMLFDLATCVSSGEPPAPPSCTPRTAADLCPAANDACGFLSDGCGGVVDCGGCGNGYYCDGNACRPQECTPATCADYGYTCGQHADGCGGIARNGQGAEGCGECEAGQVCGLNMPGTCGGCVQIPRDDACPPNSCGIVSDGCGGTYDCGDCVGDDVCGGGGPNLCGPGSCDPISQGDACDGLDCGTVSDGCGGSHLCGTCQEPDTCGGAGVPNVCGHISCTPIAANDACLGLECGWVSDGCGGAIGCGTCPGGGVCGGAGPNLCGDPCTPTTCEAQGAECGSIADQCGGLLNCGGCPPEQTCGAAGPNLCGGGTCAPVDCATANAECGLIGDGCGGVVDCGVCTEPGETCGGSGVPNQCGLGQGGCTPTSCEATGVECGSASDGCGGLLSCGTCPPGFVCERGVCEGVLQ